MILDGGTGTELERRGVAMDDNAWCGPATLENAEVLHEIHRNYIAAGADVVTANTYASSRLMLEPAGLSDSFEEINRTAVRVAHRAREASDRRDVLVAGSLSHMIPFVPGTANHDRSRAPSPTQIREAFAEMATLLREEGCDLIILEMMYVPGLVELACEAALATGLPVWAGFSARRGEDGALLSHAPETDIPFAELVREIDGFGVAAAGVMHTPANILGDAISVLRQAYAGPLMAYPDSGYFSMPHWQFEDVIAPDEFLDFATVWVRDGVQIVGGCCGLSPAHIAVLEHVRDGRSS